eukprot:TRINITY_DN12991_c0_g2_i2.p1 TRINITY_DN12991_c0_g2~~TRINITY_DN12991_c0_g2_i2.p1  ORF type:complete len:147 (-),score=52.81 TRINITY_DN12991_c0_g2_i2:251-691(-)
MCIRDRGYGVDFILDTDLNLWLLEVNGIPAMEGTSEMKVRFLTTLLHDQLNIMFSQIRSRHKRVNTFLDELVEDLMEQEDANDFSSIDLFAKKEEFRNLIRNHIDPEFEIAEDNTFTKVLDENFEGGKAYPKIHESCWNPDWKEGK